MAVAARRRGAWMTSPDWALALLILTDQFSANAFHGVAHMYSTDPLARLYVRQALEAEHMDRVEADMRMFFLFPFAHSENERQSLGRTINPILSAAKMHSHG